MAEVNSRNFEVTISSEGVAGPAGPVGPIGPQGPKGDKGDRGGWDYATGLADGVNLNTLIAPGTYRRANSVGSTTALNYPVDGFAGFIEVIAGSTASSIQRATSWNSTAGATGSSRNTWWRAQVSGVWQAWTIISRDSEGIGSPEGVVHAAVGSRYIDTAATNGAVEWIKAFGTGPTGWKVVYGDTGVRRLAEWSNGAFTYGVLAEPTTWKPHDTASGYVRLRRNGDTVEVGIAMVQAAQASPSTIVFLPTGFRPTMTQRIVSEKWNATGVNSGAATGFHIEPTGYFGRGGNSSITVDDYYVSINATFITRDPWPTTLPGVVG